MPGVEKISIALTPDLAAAVQEAVESGGYASTSEVIREALRDWREKRRLHEQQINEMSKLWDEGIQSGPSRVRVGDLIQELEQEFGAKSEE
ncbi:MAG: type II toxin-antitoxin system ParD family antitoxin [Ktedonobacteraceae bacterium]